MIDIDKVAGEVKSTTVELATSKSMEYDAKAFIKIARQNMEAWTKSLERGKDGKPCSFKEVGDKIEDIVNNIIADEEGVYGNKHVLFLDTTRYLNFVNHDFMDLEGFIAQYMGQSFSSGLAREEAYRKLNKKFEDYEGGFDSIRSDKKDYRLNFLMDEFGEMIEFFEDRISPKKTHKSVHIVQVLERLGSILEEVGADVDLSESSDEKKEALKHYTNAKSAISKYIVQTKSTFGTVYGAIVTKVMTT